MATLEKFLDNLWKTHFLGVLCPTNFVILSPLRVQLPGSMLIRVYFVQNLAPGPKLFAGCGNMCFIQITLILQTKFHRKRETLLVTLSPRTVHNTKQNQAIFLVIIFIYHEGARNYHKITKVWYNVHVHNW